MLQNIETIGTPTNPPTISFVYLQWLVLPSSAKLRLALILVTSADPPIPTSRSIYSLIFTVCLIIYFAPDPSTLVSPYH